MTNAGQMAKKLAGGNRNIFLRKIRAVFLYWSIKVELALLPQEHRCGGRYRLGYRCQPVKCMRSSWDKVFQIRATESSRPVLCPILDHSHGNSRNALRGHEPGYMRFKFDALFGRNQRDLRECGKSREKQDNKENIQGAFHHEPFGRLIADLRHVRGGLTSHHHRLAQGIWS